jgi:hypothetical protein
MTTLRNHYETQVLWPDADPSAKEYTGPDICRTCGDILSEKEPHLTRDGKSPHNGADYTGYVVQSHHSDEAGGAVCTDCAEQEDAGTEEEENYAWGCIARWAMKDPDMRTVHIGRNGLQLNNGLGNRPTFVAGKNGRIDTAGAMALVLRDTEDECPKTERNV